MAWYAWLLVGAFALLAFVALALRVLGMSTRGRRFRALGLRAKLDFARELLRDDQVPWLAKAMLVVVVAYLAMPFDVIPDFIPVVGQLDDALVIFTAVLALILFVPRQRFEAALAEAERREKSRRVDDATAAEPPPAPIR
jgi:uncharacterized membrane protein YkvA (DUF1232 family)